MIAAYAVSIVSLIGFIVWISIISKFTITMLRRPGTNQESFRAKLETLLAD